MNRYPLFATARKTDPITSHAAVDRMNKSNALGEQQQAVLEALNENDGISAKRLGEKMAYRERQRYEWPHKRLAELETQGFVIRTLEPGDKGKTCWITAKGKKVLQCVR